MAASSSNLTRRNLSALAERDEAATVDSDNLLSALIATNEALRVSFGSIASKGSRLGELG